MSGIDMTELRWSQLTEDHDMEREKECIDLSLVRIPPDVLSRLDGFCSDLKLRILEDAARLRVGQSGSSRDWVLTNDDLLAVAGAAIEQALSNLAASPATRGSHHVRTAS
jgi:hypothetical protein